MPLVNTALTLKDLPPAPEGKTGWPWTEQSEPLPDKMADGSDWPRISIVTPNYNYGQFIEETIRSVLLQGYPNLEYIVIDGGSTDNSVEIIKKYEKWLSYWVSEKDNGQSNAINKGIKKCTGIIFNWLNSDDILTAYSLFHVSSMWIKESPTILVGSGKIVLEDKCSEWIPNSSQSISPLNLALYCQGGVGMSQPSTFLNLNAVKGAGGINESLNYIMDYTLYLNLLLNQNSVTKGLIPLSHCLSIAKLHKNAKTFLSWNDFEKEMIQVISENVIQFPLNEQKILNNHIQRLKTQVLVRNYANFCGIKGFLRLLKLFFRQPLFIFSRFYLGALKNKFLEVIN
jgi:glycosyltransferase involved in cell wall biosynthesis